MPPRTRTREFEAAPTLKYDIKYHWSGNDLLQLPLRVKGVTVQHFNSDPDNPARLVACELNTFIAFGVDRGSGFEQIEVSPDYSE
jgi:hypothetical protein